MPVVPLFNAAHAFTANPLSFAEFKVLAPAFLTNNLRIAIVDMGNTVAIHPATGRTLRIYADEVEAVVAPLQWTAASFDNDPEFTNPVIVCGPSGTGFPIMTPNGVTYINFETTDDNSFLADLSGVVRAEITRDSDGAVVVQYKPMSLCYTNIPTSHQGTKTYREQ